LLIPSIFAWRAASAFCAAVATLPVSQAEPASTLTLRSYLSTMGFVSSRYSMRSLNASFDGFCGSGASVAHYNRVRHLNLTVEQQRELVEYLKSL
jgi:polyisoprenoid-binding protein YceI